MQKENNSGESTQGVETPSLSQVSKWVKDDCARAISFLNAIHSDQDLINHVAQFMLGRFENAKHADELKKQTKLDV